MNMREVVTHKLRGIICVTVHVVTHRIENRPCMKLISAVTQFHHVSFEKNHRGEEESTYELLCLTPTKLTVGLLQEFSITLNTEL